MMWFNILNLWTSLFIFICKKVWYVWKVMWDRRGGDRMVVGFTTTYEINSITTNVVSLNSAHATFVGVLYTTVCDKVCNWLVAGQWISPGTTASSTNKTDGHDITEILLKFALKHHNTNPLTGDVPQLLRQYTFI
jgi:hypothetical protein